LNGALYIYSQWEGYWEQGSYDKTKNWLARHSIPKVSIHTSGHASPGDLKRLVTAINPHRVVPIHTFYPEKYADLFPDVELHTDNDWWEV
jgi:ribonuclease J